MQWLESKPVRSGARRAGKLAFAVLRFASASLATLAVLRGGAPAGNSQGHAVPFPQAVLKAVASGKSGTGDSAAEDSDSAVPNQFVVLLRTSASSGRHATGLSSALPSQAVIRRLPGVGSGLHSRRGTGSSSVFSRLMLIELSQQSDTAAIVGQLARHPDVLSVEPNWILKVDGTGARPRFPNDFEFGRLWNLHNTGQNQGVPGADVNAPEGWSVTTGSPEVRVAVIDTGVDFYHPDLERNLWVNSGEIAGNGVDDDGNGCIDDVHGFDFVWRDSDPMDDMVHGTHVSGIIGAKGNNTIGVVGVAWSVSIMALKAFDETGDGRLWDVIEALHYALANGAHIVNASWGQNERSQALTDAIAELREAGLVIVASAGNKQSERLGYPAALPGVIAVAAVNNRDERSFFSNFGPRVDVAAPGENVLSTVINNRYDNLSGTSMAAPHVSGIAALVRASHPHFSAREVEDILRNSVEPTLSLQYIGLGRVNAAGAVRVDEPLPNAGLDLPQVLSGRIDIKGTASGPRFSGYKIEWGRGPYPTNWISLGTGASPVSDGVLLSGVTTDTLDEGEYVVRLTVWDTAGRSATARAVTTVRNVYLKSPMDNDVLRAGELVEVRGTVFGSGRTYKLEYGVGWRPAKWLTNAVQVADGGERNVLDGTLGWWDTRRIETNEFYSLKLTALDDGKVVGESISQLIFLDGLTRPGWPQYVWTEGEYPTNDWRQVTVADIDHDGLQEILRVDAGTADGKPAALRVYGHDGSLRWVRELVTGDPCSDVAVVGDTDGDGFMEVFLDVGGRLFAFGHDGSALAGDWPVTLDVSTLGKVLADLDGDGRLELVGYAQSPSGLGTQQNRELVVYDATGHLLHKWRLLDFSVNIDVPRMFPAVGNLDDDPNLEIVAVDGGNDLVMFDMDKPDGPVWRAHAYGRLTSSPVLGDIDGDERVEIVVGAYDAAAKGGTGTAGGVYAWDRHGTQLHGWPVLVDQSFPFAPAMADLNGDGCAEIIIVSSGAPVLHALQADGFELRGWPVGPIRNFMLRSSPVVGDIDGDGRPDVIAILVGQNVLASMNGDMSKIGGLHAWNAEGVVIDLNPLPQMTAFVMETVRSQSAPPVLTDLDGDGFLDIVATTSDDFDFPQTVGKTFRKNRYTITVWSLPTTPTAPDLLPWPMFQHDPQLSGHATPRKRVNEPPQIDRIPDQTVRSGTPFFPIDLDRYVTDPDDQPGSLLWSVENQHDLGVTINEQRLALVAAPAPDWTGRELLRFVVRDRGGLFAETTANFEVRADYEPPLAITDTAGTNEDEPVEVDVLANDTHPHGLTLTLLNFSRSGHGHLEQTDHGTLRYVPAPDFFGQDSFSYTAGDGEGGMAMANVTIDVVPVQDPPSAAPDRVITNEDESVEIDVLGNDFDPDGDTIALAWFGQAGFGTVSTSDDGSLRYTPNRDASGTDRFNCGIQDEYGNRSEAEVTVMVKPVNDPPVATPLSYTINRNTEQSIIYQAADPDNDTLTFRVVEGPQHGELWSYPDIGTYYPKPGFNGLDTFTYAASDGTVESTPALVSINVVDVNNPPVALDQSIATRVGRPVSITLAARDADNDPVTFILVGAPEHGKLTGTGSNYVYSPKPAYVGQDRFVFQAGDGQDWSVPATVTIRMTDQNTAPSALKSAVEVFLDTPTEFTLEATDEENDPLSYILLSLPAHGKLKGTPPTLVYAPQPGYLGPDRFSFSVSDGEFESGPAIVTVAVVLPNHAPVALDQTLVLPAGRKSRVPLTIEDADGNTLRLAILKGPRNGIISGTGTNYFYEPRPDFAGTDRFTYRAWDGTVYSDVATVTLSVEDYNPPAAPQFELVRVLDGGIVQLSIRTSPGYNLQLFSSTNMVDWAAVTNIVAREELTTLIDFNRDNAGARFYRARSN